jgi:hypothetical protein
MTYEEYFKVRELTLESLRLGWLSAKEEILLYLQNEVNPLHYDAIKFHIENVLLFERNSRVLEFCKEHRIEIIPEFDSKNQPPSQH